MIGETCRALFYGNSYISHLIEDGVDPLFVQFQADHSWASATATYASPRQLHQADEIREVCPGTKARRAEPDPCYRRFLTLSYGEVFSATFT